MDKNVALNINHDGLTSIICFETACLSRVDHITEMSREIKSHIEAARPKRLILDFQQVKFFTSQVLGMLLEVRQKLQSLDGQVLLCGIDPRLGRVFRVTHLDRIFSFLPESPNRTN